MASTKILGLFGFAVIGVAGLIRLEAAGSPDTKVRRAAEGRRRDRGTLVPESPIGVKPEGPASAKGIRETVPVREVQPPAGPSPENAEDSRASIDERAALLGFELGLTQDQRAGLESEFLRRESEIAAWHSEIRSSGVLNVWAHDRRAREILIASQTKIATLLGPDQARKYFELLESGRLNEGIAFEVSPGMIVVR